MKLLTTFLYFTPLIIVPFLLLFIISISIIFYRTNEPEHNLPIWAKIFLIIPSLSWFGTGIGLYILLRKKKFKNIKRYKFNESTRNYSIFLIIISALINLILKL